MAEESLNVRVPAELKRELERRAKKADRSMSGEVRQLLTREFAQDSTVDAGTSTEPA